jgi:hypothetical protein
LLFSLVQQRLNILLSLVVAVAEATVLAEVALVG